MNKETQQRKKHPILATVGTLLIALILLSIGQYAGCKVMEKLTEGHSDIIAFAGDYFAFIGIWIFVLGYSLIFKKNRELIKELGTKAKGNNVKTALLVGIPCGIGLNLLSASVALMHGDIKLTYLTFNPLWILLFIFVIMVQSGAEELVCRWFIYQKVKAAFPKLPILAVIINAVFFAAIHLMNPGMTVNSFLNITFVAILYSLIVYYFDSFWACVVAHTSWNFCQNILLGLPNSGIVSSYSIFGLDAASATDSFAYNVGFGIEGTYVTDAILLIAIVVVAVIGHKRKVRLAA